MRVLDIGCGSKKTEGAVGMDIHGYPGVDIVHNLESYPWPLETNQFDRIICQHVIEHIDDVAKFMKELHRVGKDGAAVEVTTPHFSSINSWTDPTHKKHFSVQWYKLFTEGYLIQQVGRFEIISSNVSFGKSIRAKLGNWMARLRGTEKWEKNYAFIYPGMDIFTVLKISKKN